MAGHSKWANIKHRKGRQDALRGKLFAKLAKGIEAAARAGGSDLDSNASLVQAVAKAKGQSMPNDNIDRAIKRGAGEMGGGAVYDELFYEGYGPGGVAILVQILTDNRNRASSDVRVAFTRNGGNLGEPGSVAYLFDQKGLIVMTGDEDEIMMTALDSGAEDIKESGEGEYEVITDPRDFRAVFNALSDSDQTLVRGEVTMLPQTNIDLNREKASTLLRMIEALEDLDDVQEVYNNGDISDEVMELLAAE
jgi:YebC/PmpR family DNA-binding regulatory protein